MYKIIRLAGIILALQLGHAEICLSWQIPEGPDDSKAQENAESTETSENQTTEPAKMLAAPNVSPSPAPPPLPTTDTDTDTDPLPDTAPTEEPEPAAASPPDPGSDSQSDPEAEKLATGLRRALHGEVDRNPKLFGAVVTAETNPQTSLQARIVLIVDEADDSVTSESIHPLIGEKTARQLCDIVIRKHPARTVLSRLRDHIAESDSLENCRIADIQFEGVPLVLVLHGLIARDAQRAELTTAAAGVLKDVYSDHAFPPPVPSGKGLKLIAPPDNDTLKQRQRIAAELERLVERTPELFGADLEVYRDAETEEVRFAPTVVVDVDQKDVPIEKVREVLSEQLPADSADPVRIVRHPALSILKGLKDAAAEHSSEVRIDGLSYTAIGDAPEIEIRGAITNDELRTELTTVAGRLLKDAYNDDGNIPVPTLKLQKLDEPDLASVRLGRDTLARMRDFVRGTSELFGADLEVYRDAATEEVRFAPGIVAGTKNDPKNDPKNDAASQEKAAVQKLSMLLTDALPSGASDPLQVIRQPLDIVLEQLQSAGNDRDSLDGVRIEGIYVTNPSDPGNSSAEIIGKMARYTQKAELTTLAAELLKEAFGDTVAPTPDLDAMELRRPDEGKILAWLAEYMQDRPAFTGCKVDGARYTTHSDPITVDLAGTIAHRGQRTLLKSAVAEFLSKVFGPARIVVTAEDRISVERLPTGALTHQLQLEVDINEQLGGCVIREAQYVEDQGTEFLQLTARISEPEQRATLQTFATAYIRDRYGESWPLAVLSDDTEVIPSSYLLARRLFTDGLNSYVGGDYEEAYRAFTQVNVEAPGRLYYQYWRVVAEIAAGRLDDAYHHIQPLVRKRVNREGSYSDEYIAALHSLERVQGPIRSRLNALEQRALLDGRGYPEQTASVQ